MTGGCVDCNIKDEYWLQCTICKAKYHHKCCGVDASRIPDVLEYHCAECTPDHGPSVERYRSKRRRVKYNYAQLDQGVIEVDATHMHVGRFFEKWPKHPFPIVTGDDLPELTTPLIVPAKDYDTLGMQIPENINAEYVASVLGSDMPLPVVDVVTQDILPGWTLGSWVKYLRNPDHRKTYNVISLEFSRTPLKNQIVRPKYVRDNDLVDKIWPPDKPEKPEVGYYCLMGVKGSYTDFHVDFGGTSVYYHIIEGAKTFLFVPPTEANLRAYEQWCMNPKQSTTWFPDLLRKKECYRVDLNAGDTMLLPSGWIHAVYTPADSFVIGGNFLSLEFLKSHMRVDSLEQRIQTPKKFTFPNFLACLQYLQNDIREGKIRADEDTIRMLDQYIANAAANEVKAENDDANTLQDASEDNILKLEEHLRQDLEGSIPGGLG